MTSRKWPKKLLGFGWAISVQEELDDEPEWACTWDDGTIDFGSRIQRSVWSLEQAEEQLTGIREDFSCAKLVKISYWAPR